MLVLSKRATIRTKQDTGFPEKKAERSQACGQLSVKIRFSCFPLSAISLQLSCVSSAAATDGFLLLLVGCFDWKILLSLMP